MRCDINLSHLINLSLRMFVLEMPWSYDEFIEVKCEVTFYMQHVSDSGLEGYEMSLNYRRSFSKVSCLNSFPEVVRKCFFFPSLDRDHDLGGRR